MFRKMFMFFTFGLLIGVIGCWGTSTEVKNASDQTKLVPSQTPESGDPELKDVRITDKSPQGPRRQDPTKTDGSKSD